MPLQSWSRQEKFSLIQTVLLGFAVLAAAYAGVSTTKFARQTIRAQSYQNLSANWTELSNRLYTDEAVLRVWNGQTLDDEISKRRARALATDLFTAFDMWLFQERLGTFPVLGRVRTWDWWHSTIVGFFETYPCLIAFHIEDEKYWSPWLTKAREEARLRVPGVPASCR